MTVEDQKNSIRDEIIRVSEKISTDQKMIDTLQGAKNEIQFSKSLAPLKHALPHLLFINGHNSFTLLHGALRSRPYTQTDKERCNSHTMCELCR